MVEVIGSSGRRKWWVKAVGGSAGCKRRRKWIIGKVMYALFLNKPKLQPSKKDVGQDGGSGPCRVEGSRKATSTLAMG